jgi:hypothetical protein
MDLALMAPSPVAPNNASRDSATLFRDKKNLGKAEAGVFTIKCGRFPVFSWVFYWL